MRLYLTSDRVGTWTGGGQVTAHEYAALSQHDRTFLYSRNEMGNSASVWDDDEKALAHVRLLESPIELCHVYAGTFSRTVAHLKARGCKVTYTAAAHSIERSKKAHLDLGLPYDYPHLTDPNQFRRYVDGYRMADVVICPSELSAAIMRGYGCNNVVVIPHGCNPPEHVTPLPSRFTVGYLGSFGPDKGVRHLLAAWKELAWHDATLILAGSESRSAFACHLLQRYGGGNVHLAGWVTDVRDYYDRVHVHVQPSESEGFGMEVLEAMAHGRFVICSRQAGATDLVFDPGHFHFATWPCEPGTRDIVEALNCCRARFRSHGEEGLQDNVRFARTLSWERVRDRYREVWEGLA